MSDARNILAGTKAAGTAGLSLAWICMAGQVTLPADAKTPLDPAFLDLGNCDTKGVTVKTNVSTNPITSFGSPFDQGTLITKLAMTVDITPQETNPLAVALYRGVPLDAVTVASDGSFSVGMGFPDDIRYSIVFDGFSQFGDPLRFVCPNVGSYNPGDLVLQMGQPLDRAVTLTLYPDASGKPFYEYYLNSNLATAAAAWQATHAYALNDLVTISGDTLKCTTAGTSGSTAPTPPASVGGTVTDGTVTWTRTA